MSLKIWLPLNGNIENQGTLNTTSRLPSGYTEVKYLQSSGTQWINTNDKLTSDFKMVYSINVQNGGSDSAMPWASYATGNRYDCQFPEHTAIWFQRAGGTLYRGNLDGTILNKDLYIEESLNSVSINGKVYGTGSFTFTQNNVNVGLFNSPGSSYQSANKCRTFKWFAGNTLKHCFIPCYRNSDNKPGMYDTVTGTFYTNAGSGEFGVGPAVTCSITNNGATVDNNGKIGKCYSFNGGTITSTAPKVTNKITVAAWIKAPDNNSVWKRVCGMQSTSTSWESASALLLLNGTDLYFSISNGSTCTRGYCVFNIGDSTKWFHACGTYDGTTARLYVNGVLKKEYAITTTIENTPVWLGGTSAGERFTGKLNDFRIYDEALSADQIKEISRGMVLHYKMCGNVQTPNNCYAYPTFDISATNGGWAHWTYSGGSGSFAQNTDKNFIFRSGQTYSHKVVCDSSATYDYLCYQEPTFSGGYRSMCAIIKASDGARITENICYPHWNSRNGGVEINKWTSINKLRDGFYLCKCEGIKQDGSNDLVGIYVRPGKTIYISECYLENDYEKCSDFWTRTDIEYDGSGFKNHGTVSGNVTLSEDSPRYTGSYVFNGNDTSILIGDLSKLTPDGNFTMSCWIKKSEFSSKGYDTIFGGPSGFELESKNDTTNERKFCAHNWGGGKWDYEFNKWYHLVMVRTSSNTKFYFSSESGFNNTPVITGDPGSIPSGNYYVGSWRSATEQNYKGLVSDFRIYATALDATDVAELYKLGK